MANYHLLFNYDADQFAKVARIVIGLNPYMKGDRPEDLVARMLSQAATCGILENPGYMATGGYVLTATKCPDGRMYVYPSIGDCLWKESDFLP